MQAHQSRGALASLTALNLTGCMVGAAGIAHLSPVLSAAAASLRALCLADNGLGGEGCKRVCEALLSGNAPSTAPGTANAPLALQYLDLSVNNIGEAGCRALAGMAPSSAGLEHLLLAANGISAEGGAALAPAFPRLTALVGLQVWVPTLRTPYHLHLTAICFSIAFASAVSLEHLPRVRNATPSNPPSTPAAGRQLPGRPGRHCAGWRPSWAA